jgi:ribosomal protein S18 acetylase RimI-like enzyme
VRVRRAEPGDAAAIAAVHVRAWRAAYRGLLPEAVLDSLSVEARERAWEGLLRDGHLTLVAEEGGEVAGFCTVVAPARDTDAPADAAELAALYVDPPRWRGGVGRELMAAAVRELDARWAVLTVWVIAANAAAVAFYERFGFARDGAERREPIASLGAAEAPSQVRLRMRR